MPLLPYEETLVSTAEIAAVFVGFAALVTAIGAGRRSEELDRQRLRFVVVAGLGTSISALLPIAVNAYGGDLDFTWRFAGLFNLLCNWSGGLLVLRWGATKRREFAAQNPVALALISLLEIVIELSLFWLVLGLAPGLAPALFLTALFAGLAQASVAFLVLVESLLTPE